MFLFELSKCLNKSIVKVDLRQNIKDSVIFLYFNKTQKNAVYIVKFTKNVKNQRSMTDNCVNKEPFSSNFYSYVSIHIQDESLTCTYILTVDS